MNYWVILTGRGTGQNLTIMKSNKPPHAQFAGMSFSSHGPYSLKDAAAYARSLGGKNVVLVDSDGVPIGMVNVTAANPVTTNKVGKTTEDTSQSSVNARVKAAGGTLGNIPNPLDALASDLAAGIEHGVITALKDLWMTVYPALEILTGVGLVILAFVLIFRGQIMSIAPLVAAMA